MYREKIEELKAWKEGKSRKPLILQGARQVGKTWLLSEFGRTQYAQMVYVNFEGLRHSKTCSRPITTSNASLRCSRYTPGRPSRRMTR